MGGVCVCYIDEVMNMIVPCYFGKSKISLNIYSLLLWLQNKLICYYYKFMVSNCSLFIHSILCCLYRNIYDAGYE